jgi:hypothetical protein
MTTIFMFRQVICRLPVDVGFGFRADHQAISPLRVIAESSAVKFHRVRI